MATARIFVFKNGAVTTISMKTGKIVDFEPMTRACKACQLKEGLKKDNPLAYEHWKESHLFNFNNHGTAGNNGKPLTLNAYGSGQLKKINYDTPTLMVTVTVKAI